MTPSSTSSSSLLLLEEAVERFTATLRHGDLTAPVAACAPWTLTDLAHHLAGVHRWARTAIVEGREGEETIPGAPTERAALVAWSRAEADAVVEALRAADPDTACWTFGLPPHRVAFWARRQLQETVLHAWDAEGAVGRTPTPIPADLAHDGIDEIVGMFFPRQVRLGRIPPLADAVAVEADGRRWVLAGDGTGEPVSVDAVVRGPAEALLLLLWHRAPLDDVILEVDGDRAAVERVLVAALTP